MNFWSQLGSPGGGSQVVMLMGFRLLGLLGAKMGPRAPKQPQESQEAPKTASKTDFGAILVDFWLIFCWFLGWFGGSLRLLLLVVVLVCCLVGLLVCWSVGSLLCWFSGLLVVCLSAVWPQSPRHGGGRPAGQLYIYPPPSPWGEHGVLNSVSPSSCQVLCKIFKILFRQPSALPEIAQIGRG